MILWAPSGSFASERTSSMKSMSGRKRGIESARSQKGRMSINEEEEIDVSSFAQLQRLPPGNRVRRVPELENVVLPTVTCPASRGDLLAKMPEETLSFIAASRKTSGIISVFCRTWNYNVLNTPTIMAISHWVAYNAPWKNTQCFQVKMYVICFRYFISLCSHIYKSFVC